MEALKRPAFRDDVRSVIDSGRVKIQMLCPKIDPYWPEHFVVLTGAYEGKTFGQIARQRGGDPIDAVCDMLIEDPDAKFNQRDLRRLDPHTEVFLQHPSCAVGLDTFVCDTDFHLDDPFPGSIRAHQNTYGMMPRYIRRFVREKGVLSLEEAIRKVTSLPADRLGLAGRGRLQPGDYADIVLFDPAHISDTGDWLEPAQAPVGIASGLRQRGDRLRKRDAHRARSGQVLRRGRYCRSGRQPPQHNQPIRYMGCISFLGNGVA